MMRPSNKLDHVWLAREAVDFRKGINGLSVLVEEQLAHNPFSGQLFVFVNKKRDKVKILYWGVPVFVCGRNVWSGTLQVAGSFIRRCPDA
jgi:transposase